MSIGLKFIESLFKVKIYPCYKNSSCISKEEYQSLNKEIRALGFQAFGSVPEYQCFLEDYSSIQDKLLVIHRNKHGKLDGFSSCVIIQSPDKKIAEVMHLGIYIVQPEARHQHIQFKLGLAATAAYMGLSGLKSHYWITNLSSVLGTLAIVDKMYYDVYPGLKKEKPSEKHLEIAKLFQKDVVARCFINPKSQFDYSSFVYKNANTNNCFLKKSSDKQFHSLNSQANQFYTKIADLDNGDAVLQICKIDYFHFYLAMLAYMYRIGYRDLKMRKKNRRQSDVPS